MVAAAAVLCALSGSCVSQHQEMTPDKVALFGPEVQLPASVIILSASESRSAYDVTGCGSAALVDAEYGLYLTASHVIEGTKSLWITGPKGAPVPVRFDARWTDIVADLAVVQALSPGQWQGVPALPVASQPPSNQEYATLYGYHPVFVRSCSDMRGFVQHYTVLKNATDGCVDLFSCAYRAIIDRKIESGEVVMSKELEFIYDQQIYALHRDHTRFGLRHGMSGGPLIDQAGLLVGVARAFATYDESGKYIFFSAAYLALPLIDQARRDISDVP